MKWDRVQAKEGLVGVFDQDVLALIHTEHHVDDCADNSPAVVQVERHLRGEVAWLVGEHTKNDVIVVVLGVGTRNESAVRLVSEFT